MDGHGPGHGHGPEATNPNTNGAKIPNTNGAKSSKYKSGQNVQNTIPGRSQLYFDLPCICQPAWHRKSRFLGMYDVKNLVCRLIARRTSHFSVDVASKSCFSAHLLSIREPNVAQATQWAPLRSASSCMHHHHHP